MIKAYVGERREGKNSLLLLRLPSLSWLLKPHCTTPRRIVGYEISSAAWIHYIQMWDKVAGFIQGCPGTRSRPLSLASALVLSWTQI